MYNKTCWPSVINAILICMIHADHLLKTFTYMGSTLAEDGELDAEVTHRVQSGWKIWKRVSGVLCDRKMNVNINGKV